MIYNGMFDTLPYKTRLQPYATYFVLLIITVLTLTNGFNCEQASKQATNLGKIKNEPLTSHPVFFPSEWNVADFLAAYITIPIFLALYFGHKIYFAAVQAFKGETWDGTQKSGSRIQQFFGGLIFATRTSAIDVMTGKREMDELEALDQPPVAKNWLEKFWFWLA